METINILAERKENRTSDCIGTSRILKLDASMINAEFIAGAEGTGFSGWNCPIWAEIEEDSLTLSLGSPVSKGTSFVDNNGNPILSKVGFVECWNKVEEDETEADLMADEIRGNLRDFYRDEIKGKNLQSLGEGDEEYLMFNIAMFAKSKGYDFIELV